MGRLTSFIKNIRGEKSKGRNVKSLYLRLFLYLACYVAAVIFGFVFIISVANAIADNSVSASVFMKSELDHASRDITDDFVNLANHAKSLSDVLSLSASSFKESNLAEDESILDDDEYVLELISDEFPSLLSYLNTCQCSSVFVYHVNGLGATIRRSEPGTVSVVHPKFYYFRGPSKIARDNRIEFLPQWKMKYTDNECELFEKLLNDARENIGMDKSYLYHCSNTFYYDDDSDPSFLITVPIIDENECIGICGMSISSKLFKMSYLPENSILPHVFTCLIPKTEQGYLINQGLVAGNSFLNSTFFEEGVYLSHNKDDDVNVSCVLPDGTEYKGISTHLSIYPRASIYSNEAWEISVMTLASEIDERTWYKRYFPHFMLVLLLAGSLLLAAVFSKRFIKPVSDTLNKIVNSDDITNISSTPYVEINDLLDFLKEKNNSSIDDSTNASAEVINSSDSSSKELLSDDINFEEYKIFLENLKTLTSAERRVFDLYVEEYKATEIAEILCISINTVKYHNSNIYSKLNVSSRKELLKFIRHMRKTEILKNKSPE